MVVIQLNFTDQLIDNMQNKVILFVGPRQLGERLHFKFGQSSVVRHINNLKELQNQEQQLAYKGAQIFLIVKPQYQAEFKEAVASIPNAKMFVDRVDDSKVIEYREYAVGSEEIMGQLAEKCTVLDDLSALPKDVTTNGNILTQIFLPESQKAAASDLQKRPNIVCFAYKQLEAKVYCVGEGQAAQDLAAREKGTQLKTAEQLRGNPDIFKKVPMIIYCKKDDQEKVLDVLTGYKGHKRVIVSKQLEDIIKKNKGDQYKKELGISAPEKKVLVYLKEPKLPDQEPYLRNTYDGYTFKKVDKPEQIQNIPQLKEQKTKVVLAAYKYRQQELETAAKSLPSKPLYKYFNEQKSRLLVFVTENQKDPNQGLVKSSNKYNYYQLVKKPEQVKQIGKINSKDTDVKVVAYQSKRQQISDIEKSLQNKDRQLSVEYLPDPRSTLLVFVTDKPSDSNIQKVQTDFKHDSFATVKTPAELQSVKNIKKDNVDLVLVGYKSKQPQLDQTLKKKLDNPKRKSQLRIIPDSAKEEPPKSEPPKKNKLVVFVCDKADDKNQKNIPQKGAVNYRRVGSPQQLSKLPELKDPNTEVMVYAYRRNSSAVQQIMKKASSQPKSTKYFDEEMVVFVTDKPGDQNVQLTKKKYNVDNFKVVPTAKQLEKLPEVKDPFVKLTVVHYEENAKEVQSVMPKRENLTPVQLPNPQAIKKRRLLGNQDSVLSIVKKALQAQFGKVKQEEGKKVLVYLTQKELEDKQAELKKKYPGFEFKRIQKPAELKALLEPLKQKDQVVIAAYSNNKTDIENESKICKSKPTYQYFDPVHKKQLVFVSDKEKDPMEAKVKQTNKFDYYQTVKTPAQLEKVKNINNPVVDVTIVGYKPKQTAIKEAMAKFNSPRKVDVILLDQIKPPQVKAPQIKPPQIKPPEIKAPEIKAPEIKPPEIKAPQVKPPEIKAPQVKPPEFKAPQVKPPEIKAPQVKPPEIKPPEIKAPQIKPTQIKPPQIKPPQIKSEIKPPQLKLPQSKKVIVFICQRPQDPQEKNIPDKTKFPYQRISSPADLAKVPEVLNPNAQVLVYAYRRNSKPIEQVFKKSPCKSSFNYFDQRATLFITNDPATDQNTQQLKAKYPGKFSTCPAKDLKKNADFADPFLKLNVVSYQAAKAEVKPLVDLRPDTNYIQLPNPKPPIKRRLLGEQNVISTITKQNAEAEFQKQKQPDPKFATVFLVEPGQEDKQSVLKQKYPKHSFKKINNLTGLRDVPQLRNTRDNVVLAAFANRKIQLENEAKTYPNKPTYQYFDLVHKKLLIFVSDKDKDPNQQKVKDQNKHDTYQLVKSTADVPKVKGVNDNLTDVTLVGYKSKEADLNQSKKKLEIQNRLFTVKTIEQKRNKLVVFISDKASDPQEQKIPEKSTLPYKKIKSVQELKILPQFKDPLTDLIVYAYKNEKTALQEAVKTGACKSTLNYFQVPQPKKEQPKKPVEQPKKAVEQLKKPDEQSKKPVEQLKKPIQQPKKPVQQIKKPIELPKKPIQQPKKPIQQPKKPVEQPKKPVEQPKKPAQQPKKPTLVQDPKKADQIQSPTKTQPVIPSTKKKSCEAQVQFVEKRQRLVVFVSKPKNPEAIDQIKKEYPKQSPVQVATNKDILGLHFQKAKTDVVIYAYQSTKVDLKAFIKQNQLKPEAVHYLPDLKRNAVIVVAPAEANHVQDQAKLLYPDRQVIRVNSVDALKNLPEMSDKFCDKVFVAYKPLQKDVQALTKSKSLPPPKLVPPKTQLNVLVSNKNPDRNQTSLKQSFPTIPLKKVAGVDELAKLPQLSDKFCTTNVYGYLGDQAKIVEALKDKKGQINPNFIDQYSAEIAFKKRSQEAQFALKQMKVYIKEENRQPKPRQRVVFVGSTFELEQVKKDMQDKYGNNIVPTSFANFDKFKKNYQAPQLPTLYVFDQNEKSEGLSFAKKLQDKPANIFVLSDSPKEDLPAYEANKNVSVISYKKGPVVDEVGHYLGGTDQPLVKNQPRKQYGKLKLFVPEQSTQQYEPLAQKYPRLITLKPYRKLNQVDNSKNEPCVIVLRPEDQKKVNDNYGSNTHLVVKTPYPSEKAGLLKNPKVAAVAATDGQLADQVQKFIGNSDQQALVRPAPQTFTKLTVVKYNPGKFDQIDKLYDSLKQKYPKAKFVETDNLASVNESPVLVLCEQNHEKPVTEFVKSNKQAYSVVMSPAPSQLKTKFAQNPNILAVSHKKQPIIDKVGQLLKEEVSISTPPASKVSKMHVLLVDQPDQQKKIWSQLERASKGKFQVEEVRSIREAQKKDMLSRPLIVVANQQDKGNATLLMKSDTNKLNPHLHLFVRAEHPSDYRKNLAAQPRLKAVSHQQEYLQKHALTFVAPQPNKQPLLNKANRQQFKRWNLLWQDDDSQQSKQALQKLYDNNQNELKVNLIKSVNDITKVSEPTIVVAPVSQAKHVLQLCQKPSSQPLFFFLHCDYPGDRQKLFRGLPKISMIANSSPEITEQIQHYVKKIKEEDLVKQLERKKFHNPKAVFYNFNGSRFQKEGDQVLNNLHKGYEVCETNSLEDVVKEVKGNQSILVCHCDDKEKCLNVCKQLEKEAGFRMIMLSDSPTSDWDKFIQHKRFAASCTTPDAVLKQMSHYVGSTRTKLRSIQEDRDKGEKKKKKLKTYNQLQDLEHEREREREMIRFQKKFSYLKKRGGRLVWNMEENVQYAREKELLKLKPSIAKRIWAYNPGDIYL